MKIAPATSRTGASRSATERLGRSLQRIVMAVSAIASAPACGGSGPAVQGLQGGGVSSPSADASLALEAGADASPGASPAADASVDAAVVSNDPCAPILLDPTAFDDSGSTCARYVELPCGLSPEAGVMSGCTLDPVTCHNSCQSDLLYGCGLAAISCVDGGPTGDASVVLDCVVCAGAIGRRPHGLRPRRGRMLGPAVGAYFAETARLEAASVVAFRELHQSLVGLGAPRALRRAAERAVADERRHALMTRGLARRFGGRPVVPRVHPRGRVTLSDLMLENAAEGCVSEAYGALVARWQAKHATDPQIAAVMTAIAEDETRHATLAWRLLRWGVSRAEAQTRSEIRDAITQALARIREGLPTAFPPAVVCAAGHPSPDRARALFRHFEALVWDRVRPILAEV